MEKKSILINAMMIEKKPTGLGVYSINILNNLLPMLTKFDITVIVNSIPESFSIYDNINLIVLEQTNFIKRNKLIKKIISKSKFDIYYSLTQHFFKTKSSMNILTIHDLIPLIYPKGRIHQYIYYKLFLPIYLRKTNKVITVSNSTKRDIIKYYNYHNVNVVYCGSNYVVHKNNSKSGKKNYIMVGIHYPYKNLHFVIKAFAKIANRIEDDLIIIGNNKCRYGRYLETLINTLDMSNRIKLVGFVSEEVKMNFYQTSKALIFPSKYEGFGLPIIEAMSFGLPVICSNSSSLPEVGGIAALYFENDNEDSFFDVLSILENTNVQNNMIEKGYENVERFNWKKSATEIYNIIDGSNL